METDSDILLIAPVDVSELPSVIVDRLDEGQKKFLLFGKKIFKVVGTPVVKTLHIGSLGSGQSVTTGATRNISDNWSIIGGLTSVNMATLNKFRTDIQLRLENEETHEKMFFEKSFPLEITLSIETGDIFSIFYVRGKAENLSDGKFLNWTSFIAKDEETKQLIPIGNIPAVVNPKPIYIEKPSKFWIWAGKHPWTVTLVILSLLVIIIALALLFDK